MANSRHYVNFAHNFYNASNNHLDCWCKVLLLLENKFHNFIYENLCIWLLPHSYPETILKSYTIMLEPWRNYLSNPLNKKWTKTSIHLTRNSNHQTQKERKLQTNKQTNKHPMSSMHPPHEQTHDPDYNHYCDCRDNWTSLLLQSIALISVEL